MRSRNAAIRAEKSRWTLSTSQMERVIAFRDGGLVTASLRGKPGSSRLDAMGGERPVFTLGGPAGKGRISSADGRWELAGSKQTKLAQGELQLDVTLRRDGLEATKSWVIYPGSSIVREWVAFRNAGEAPVKVIDPSFLTASVRTGGGPDEIDFHWMTGGENQPGSWVLKTEKPTPGKPRTFDSYDAFTVDPTKPLYAGDGVNVRILVNDRQVWPAAGWEYVANANVRTPFDVGVDVQAGDRVLFLVNMNGGLGWDTTALDPTIAYADGETHVASKEFSGEQGKGGWRYQYMEAGRLVDLVYYETPRQWRKAKDNATGTPFVGAGDQHPDVGQDAARVWTAPKAGRIRVTGSVCNTGNPGGVGAPGFRMGSSTYAPWAAIYDRAAQSGIFVGWDTIGHWASSYERQADGSMNLELRLAGHTQTLAPGQAMATPKAFTGLYRDDLDNAGNACLNWQYEYMWDFTREPWFPAIRMLGYWMRGTGWGQPGVGWTGGKPDWDSAFRKVFRVADLMRSVGADVYHRDWGWWDRAGDWNGPDFATTIKYLAKHDMGQLIYAFLYTVDPESKVAREHPDWVLGGSTLDMSKPEVVDFMVGQLDAFREKWGPFEWRNDSTPTCPDNGDDTPLNGQDAGLREVITRFLAKHPDCAFQAVNGGGNNAGYDMARLSSSVSFSDGAVGIIRNYWASLILPPDKTSDIPDIWNPDQYDKAVWRGLLCINFDMTGDTWDPAKVEGLRLLIDIYHYLHAHGVVGRGVRVHRPAVTGDDATMYFQRLSADRKRGVIIPKHTAPGAVTIFPKGLVDRGRYSVSFQESEATETRTGASLMAKGITVETMPAGEIIYLNLPLHPGSKLDRTRPSAPSRVAQAAAENMGYPGVEIRWKAGIDDNWVSYYQVYRNGEPLEKVAHGTYCFDHSAGADPGALYEVHTVDGAGNVSARVPASGRTSDRSGVIDDAPSVATTYTGAWERQKGLPPAHMGTLSSTDAKGARLEVGFTGNEVRLYGKLGPTCGKASIRVDDGPEEVVDTYSADDIWGVCVYRKSLAAGRHTLTVTVLGERGPRSGGATVHIDGLRYSGQ